MFGESYEYAPKEENYLIKFFSRTYNSFITLGLMFPPLWNSILLAPSNVSMKTMLDFGRCSKNTPWHVPLVYVEIA